MALTRIGSVGLATGIDINAGVGTFTGNVTIGGTLTYEDVTNVDSIGIITARSNILVGSGITLSPDGDVSVVGFSSLGTGSDGGVELFHQGTSRLSSASYGIAVNGNVLIGEEIVHGGDSDTKIKFPTADTFTVETGGSERVRITSSGSLLMNHTTGRYDNLLQIEGTGGESEISVVRNSANTSGAGLVLGKSRTSSVGGNTIVQSGDKLGVISFGGADGTDLASLAAQITGEVDGTPGENDMPGRIVFKTTADGASTTSERLRINSDGRVLINSTTARNIGTNINRILQLESSGGGAGIAVVRNSNNANGPSLDLGKSRGYANTIVQSGDVLGQIRFAGADGTNLESSAAQIIAEVDGTPGENDMPGRLIFSTTADGAASPTERVRIASDGDITISPAGDPIVTITGSGHPQVNLTSTSGTDHCSVNFGDSDDNNAGMIQYTNSSNIMQFHTDGAERARLLDTGRFLVATQTSSQNGADGYIQSVVAGTSLGAWGSHAGSTGNRKHMRFSNPNGVVGSIHTSGSACAFNTSSDYRLKENQSAISNAISRINQLKPYTFNFKANPSEKIDGFFAHEAQELIPYAVEGEKDGEEMQSIDYGKLTPLLTAALQEAVAKIEVLESKVASLGG